MDPFSSPQGPNPSVVIYQNPDYVAGILQELYSEGLLEFMEVEQSSKLVQSGDLDKSVAPNISGRVGVASIWKDPWKVSSEIRRGRKLG